MSDTNKLGLGRFAIRLHKLTQRLGKSKKRPRNARFARRNYLPSLMQLEDRRLLALVITDLTQGLTGQALAQSLVGAGVTISNVVYAGDNLAAGSFIGGDTEQLGVDTGIVLSSGKVKELPGPNLGNVSSTLSQPGDTTLNGLLKNGVVTKDAAILEFDFVPQANELTFTYVFGSEEYPEFAPPNSSSFNDVFGFFVNGVNVALLPNSQTIVSIATVNAITNTEFYRDNRLIGGKAPFPAELDGFTVPLVGVAAVNPGVVNHIKMAVADALDGSFDSAVFIRAGSFVAYPTLKIEAIDDASSENPLNDVGVFRITRSGNTNEPITVEYSVSGIATPGLDYVPLTGQVTIPAAAKSVTFDVQALDDLLVDSNETVIATLKDNPFYNIDPDFAKDTVTIFSEDEIPLEDPDDQILEGIPVTTASLTTGVIAYGMDVDMYEIMIIEGDVISFDIDIPNADLNSFIRLFDASGNQLAANDDALGFTPEFSNQESYIQYSFTTSGKYYLAVSGLGNTAFNPITGGEDSTSPTIGKYELRLSSLDLDDEIKEAIPLAIPSVTNERIRVRDDVDMYSISVIAGQSITIDIDAPRGDLFSFLRVYDSQGAVIDFVTNTVGPAPEYTLSESYLELTFSLAGTYYIGVSSVGNQNYNPITGNEDAIGNTTGKYQLILANNPGDLDDQISEAIPVVIGEVTAGIVRHGYDANMYAVNVSAGQRLAIDVDVPSLNFNSYVRLFNATGNVLATNDNGVGPLPEYFTLESYLEYTFAEAGTYYIGISDSQNVSYNAVLGTGDGRGSSAGEYRLRVATPESAVPTVTIIDNGDAKYSGIGWTNATGGYQGDIAIAGANSNLQARWSFTDLLPGQYRVSTTWVPNANRAENAPYSINGGSPILVNQRLTPTDLTANSGKWKHLATVSVFNGQLLVTLNNTSKNDVVADAVRIERIAPLPSLPRLGLTNGTTEVVSKVSTIDFGSIPFKGTATHQFTVTNRSGGFLQLSGLQVPSGFELVSGLSKSLLATNESAQFTVALQGNSIGTKSGNVSLVSNDSSQSPFLFSVTGKVLEPPLVVIVDNGDSDYLASQFTSFKAGFQGDTDYAAAGSLGQAEWKFNALLPGIYRVSATWSPHENRSLNAPFSVNGSSAIFVNQRLAPIDRQVDNAAWKDLGKFVVTENQLRVVLTAAAQGFVVADAVRVERLAILQPDAEIDVSVDGGSLVSGVSVVNLPAVPFRSTSRKEFTISNFGAQPLTLANLVVSSGFVVNSDFGKSMLAAGESTTFSIGLDTSLVGNRSGTIQFINNDSNESLYQVAVSGEVLAPPTVRILDDGEVGYSGAGFTNFKAGFQEDLKFAAKNSGLQARWTFNDLLPGEYRVAATWVPHANRATNAPYSLNGGTPILVNQQLAPNSFNDQNAAWRSLGTINISGDQLIVTLGTNTNGYVIADAIRIERILPPPPPINSFAMSAANSAVDEDELMVDRLFASGNWM